MPSYREQYPDKWLHADRLNGKAVTITITRVTLVEAFNPMTNKKEMRLAASFPGRDVMLLINKTNAQALEKIAGTDQYDQWNNIKVVLKPGRAPNGKATILVSAPVHGRVEPSAQAPVHGLVHGREEDEVVDADMEQMGLVMDEDEEFYDSPVHGPVDSEAMSGQPDPKSAGNGGGLSTKAEDVFFTITDLTTKVRNLHQQSGEPMSEKQHDYIVRLLDDFAGKPATQVMGLLVGRDVTRENRAGAEVGRYLYELLREGNPLPDETQALRAYCDNYVPKPKKQTV